MKFQSFFDISTQDGTMQIISVNAGGKDVIRRLAPFFQAYKYYKLGGVSFKLIPASTLPVDPTGLSYTVGDNLVDPRDQLTPGMCRITNGEDILEDITGVSPTDQHLLYDNMLLDPRWYKWMLQSGVKRFGKPRYWQVGQLHQDKYPGAITNIPQINTAGQVVDTSSIVASQPGSTEQRAVISSVSNSHGLFQTGHRGVLGWMPTDSLQPYFNGSSAVREQPFLASVPEIELFKILMPPAYKTKYYYRAFVTETVYFKEPIVMNVNGLRPIDVFHTVNLGPANLPTTSNPVPITDAILDVNTGGNDGSN